MKTKENELNLEKSLLEASIPQDTKLVPHVIEIGEVIYVGDGICKIKGLPSARIDDMVKIETSEGDVNALILGLSQDIVETVVLGEFKKIAKGNIVKSTKKRVQIPVGEAVLGRVLNPLGEPIDGKGDLNAKKFSPVEVPAPAVNMREQIKDQVRTGVLVVDSIIPVGQGQRELCIGDRKTGKTTLMTNIVKNQKGKGIYCVYVSIGGKKAKVKGILETLEQAGAMEYTTIIMASADDPPSLNYIAPYAGCAIGEYFMYQGKNAIVIYDDLSKHAKSYRQMSLLLKRSPGRDAYPGDIFFLHSRLLERASRLSKEYGGGSLTAFPCAETQSGDISEYITTNLMSITDGHIYVDTNLLHSGIVPAVDSGASVSRIGGSIQTKLLRKLSELAGSQLQRYNEVKSYENINTEITEETEREIKRGKRILEIFNQPSANNYSIEEECFLLYIVTQGKLDEMEMPEVKLLKKRILPEVRKPEYKDIWAKLGNPETTLEEIKPVIDAVFNTDFLIGLTLDEEKKEVTQTEKKELNKEGLNSTVDTSSKKSGITPDTPKPNNSIGLEAAEVKTEVASASTQQQTQLVENPQEKVELKTKKEKPIQELGEVINNIPEENPDIKIIDI